MRTPRTDLALVVLVIAIVSAACGGDADDDDPATGGTPAAVTAEVAATASGALCELATTTDVGVARATVYDRAHVTLHDIAAEASRAEEGSDAAVLIAKQRVESGLEGDALPEAFAGDVELLRAATEQALARIGIGVSGCGG